MRFCDHANNFDLISNLFQHASDFPISFNETEFRVFQAILFGKLFNQFACRSKIMPRQTGEQVMGDLEVKTAVNELDGRRADDIDGCPKLPCRERFGGSEVVS